MAKKLPTPEEYGRRLAERKKRADRVPELMRKLDTLAVGLAEQAQALAELPLTSLLVSLEELNARIAGIEKPQDIAGALETIQELQEAVISGMNSLEEAITARPEPVSISEPIDLEPLMREIRGYRLDTAPVTPEVAESVPLAYEFDDITRDENGDITGARVIPVTRH